MFRKLAYVALVLAACVGEEKQVQPRSLAAPPSDTTPVRVYVDTVRSGDTLITYSRWTVTTRLDSVWHWRKPIPLGIPVGFFGSWHGNTVTPGNEWSTLLYGNDQATSILRRIAYVRSTNRSMIFIPTGGARARYQTNGLWDRAKWSAKLNTFNTPEIRQAVNKAYRDGVIPAISVLDEPGNEGGPGNEANAWNVGGIGKVFKAAQIDSLCAEAKAIFPDVPAGPVHDWRQFQPGGHFAGQSYKVCDYIGSQYRIAKGTLQFYRDGLMAEAKRQGISFAVLVNVLDGGVQDRTAPYDCAGTGGLGTYPPNCRMTAKQTQEALMFLGPHACYVTGFRSDSAFMARSDNQAALAFVTSAFKALPRKTCKRA